MAGFVEPLRGNEAAIHVVLGQSRLLTLKKDLVNGEERGSISIGDPTIVDFDLMANPRVMRLVGLRPGVTDLSIMTPDGEIYNFEVHVVFDLRLMEAQLRQKFPDLIIRLSQLHGAVVVEGEVRSKRESDQVYQVISEMVHSSIIGPRGAERRIGGAATRTDADETRAKEPPENGVRVSDQRQAALGYEETATVAQAPTPRVEVINLLKVVYDLQFLEAQLRQIYPDAELRFSQVHGNLVVEGQVRSIRQADQVLSTVESIMGSALPDLEENPSPAIINLLRVPGVHQVMLQVQIAELNRTALRSIGADWRWAFPTGNILQTLIGGSNETVSGVFPSADLRVVLRALRTNSMLSVLAEPNLVAMSGQQASFLAGGEFPIPVPQAGVGGVGTITIEFKSFGVRLDFVPYVLDDETIRLTVSPEESSPDFSTAVEVGGFFVPGINTRRATTTVEMREGQTLAMAGLMRVSIDANTRRIPGLGDLPYIGPLFSNTTHTRQEKELLVLVTPYLVAPMNPDEVPCLPTDVLTDPNDLEFYLLNRIEGRTGRPFYPTREWDDPWKLRYLLHLEQSGRYGPVGFSAIE